MSRKHHNISLGVRLRLAYVGKLRKCASKLRSFGSLAVTLMLTVLMAPNLTASSQSATGLTAPRQPALTSEHPVLTANAASFQNCRFGIGVSQGAITTYDIAPMNFGWYVDWRTSISPTIPTGMDYYHMIRVKQDRAEGVYLPTYQITPTLDFSPTGLGPIVQANPGAVWLIGNEPDIISQDNTMPDMYAQIYHDAYHFIKGIDPTAKVAIGAVVQPTPVRLQYLDLILSEYRTKYGTSIPVDIWNIHIYIIREQRNGWGAGIPPGINVETGRLYTLQDHVDIDVFESLIVEMHTWMKERGYQNKPLIVTEWGVLMPLWFLESAGLTQNDVNSFLNNTVNYMRSTADPNLGYPADGYRLVQQAALYSLDDDSTFEDGSDRWGSYLFNSTNPYTITVTGTYYRDVIASNMVASVDLLPYQAFTVPRPLIISPTSTISPTLNAIISNAGNTPPSTSVTIRFFDVTGGGSSQIGSDVTLTPFTGCGTLREIGVVWPNLSPGVYSVRIEVDPDNQIQESIESNNVMTETVLIGTHGIYLPVVLRSYP